MIDHPNLCKFIGAALNNPDNMAIVTEYCSKGSLNDVLQNEGKEQKTQIVVTCSFVIN